MYTVIVVDDELAIRENLPKVIRFAQCDFRVCATAKNGAEALALIRSQQPNLVMVDICMPTMDGLGLIKAMNKEGYGDIPVIILSGHSDFEYAKQAVKYGVKAYLTKPVDEEEAESILKEIAETLDKQKKKTLQEVADQKKQQLLETYAARKILRGFSGDSFLHCIVMSLKTDDKEATPYRVLQAVMPKVFMGHDFFYSSMGYYYSYYLPAEYLAENVITLEKLTQQVNQALLANGLTCVVISDAQILQEDSILHENFFVHKYRMLTPIFYGEQIWGDYAKIPKETGGWEPRFGKTFFTELRSHLNAADMESALSAFDVLCDTMIRLRPSLPEVVELNHKIFYVLSTILFQAEQRDGSKEYVAPPYDWQNSTYFFPLQRWAQVHKEIIRQACAVTVQDKKMSGFGQYREILDFVRRHYREPITIKGVADKFFINAAYLGRMFQKATGVGFKQYVKDLRFAEAKQILAQTDKRVYEIAGMVGFTDSNYFTTQFTQEMGISPTEYRKKKV